MNTQKQKSTKNDVTIKARLKKWYQKSIFLMMLNWLGGTYIVCGRSIVRSVLVAPGALYDNIRTGCNPTEQRCWKKWIRDKEACKTLFLKRDNVRFLETLNDQESIECLREKHLLLQRMEEADCLKDMPKRKFLYVPDTSKEQFLRFLEECPEFVVKPNNRAGGKGISIGYFKNENIVLVRNGKEKSESIDVFWNTRKNKNLILEEKIKQHSYINQIYPHSVNSIRVHTLQVNGQVEIVRLGSVRFGAKGGNINFGNAIQVGIDQNTGSLMAYGVEIAGKVCEKHYVHPDTNYAFAGVRIPYWEGCLELAKKAALLVPEICFIGWDMAITESGPTIIEGNGAPASYDLEQLYSLPKLNRGSKQENDNILKLAEEMKNKKCKPRND